MSEVLFCSFGRSIFPKRGAGVVKSASLYTRRRRFWYACKRVGRASPGDIYLFCAFTVSFSRNG